MNEAQSNTNSTMTSYQAYFVPLMSSAEQTENDQAFEYNQRMSILFRQTSKLGNGYIDNFSNVPELEVPLYISILQYIEANGNLTEQDRKKFLLYLQKQTNHGSLEYLQIIYDKISLFILPDLIQAACPILLWADQIQKQHRLTSQQIQVLSQHPFLISVFASRAISYLKVEMAVDIWGHWYFIAPPRTLTIIRHFVSCLLEATNQTLLPQGDDTSCEESLSSENLQQTVENKPRQ